MPRVTIDEIVIATATRARRARDMPRMRAPCTSSASMKAIHGRAAVLRSCKRETDVARSGKTRKRRAVDDEPVLRVRSGWQPRLPRAATGRGRYR